MPAPSIPEKLTNPGRRFSDVFRMCSHSFLLSASLATCSCGRLGLALDSATTVPTATPAPAMAPTLIRMERARLCFAGAIAAPAGLEAATPVVFTDSAAAVPRGSCVPSCCFGEGCCPLDSRSCERIMPGLSGSAFEPGSFSVSTSVAHLSSSAEPERKLRLQPPDWTFAACCGAGAAAATGTTSNSMKATGDLPPQPTPRSSHCYLEPEPHCARVRLTGLQSPLRRAPDARVESSGPRTCWNACIGNWSKLLTASAVLSKASKRRSTLVSSRIAAAAGGD